MFLFMIHWKFTRQLISDSNNNKWELLRTKWEKIQDSCQVKKIHTLYISKP